MTLADKEESLSKRISDCRWAVIKFLNDSTRSSDIIPQSYIEILFLASLVLMNGIEFETYLQNTFGESHSIEGEMLVLEANVTQTLRDFVSETGKKLHSTKSSNNVDSFASKELVAVDDGSIVSDHQIDANSPIDYVATVDKDTHEQVKHKLSNTLELGPETHSNKLDTSHEPKDSDLKSSVLHLLISLKGLLQEIETLLTTDSNLMQHNMDTRILEHFKGVWDSHAQKVCTIIDSINPMAKREKSNTNSYIEVSSLLKMIYTDYHETFQPETVFYLKESINRCAAGDGSCLDWTGAFLLRLATDNLNFDPKLWNYCARLSRLGMSISQGN